jgi:DNA-binding GntR family transcriptional regulator
MNDLQPDGGPETGARPKPLARPVLAVQIADAVREMILEGELRAGEKVREKLLTEHFGVSRTPLREALKILASEGLLELIPNRGAIISRDTIEEVKDAFPVLAALEGVAGELAALHATESELAHIGALTRLLRQSFEESDRPEYFRINQAIHGAILAAAKNDILFKTHASVAQRIHRARYEANLTPSRWNAALAEHEAIADELSARNASRVNRLLREHMTNKLSAILQAREGS